MPRPFKWPLALLLATVVLAACEDVERLTVLLVDDACRCDHRSLEMVAAVRVRLEGADSRTSACIPQAALAQRLAALQQTLRGSTNLTDLGPGTYALTVAGYSDGTCNSPVVACGYTTFSLPATAPEIHLPVRCQLDSSGNPATISEQACLDQTTPSGSCADQPGGGNYELSGVELVNGGNCDGSNVENADSVAIALHAPSGGLLWRKCLSVPDTPQSLKEIQDSLPTPILTQLAGGQVLLMVTGHDNKSCASDDVVACGGGKITLPISGSPQVTMTCHKDTTPITEASCLSSLK